MPPGAAHGWAVSKRGMQYRKATEIRKPWPPPITRKVIRGTDSSMAKNTGAKQEGEKHPGTQKGPGENHRDSGSDGNSSSKTQIKARSNEKLHILPKALGVVHEFAPEGTGSCTR